MIKKFFSALYMVLFATSMMAQTGFTCDDPIPVDENYRGTVEANSEVWYTAWSYDLPLHVYFSPENDNSEWGPEVMIDFTCTPGIYDDPKIDSVINQLSDFGLELPVEFLCDRVVRNGKVEWDLMIDQSYRERLTEVGITYNVQAYVKVYFPEAGEISLTPDTLFQTCVNNGHYVHLGDTIDILPNDSNRVFVLPYSEWQNDSIQFTWLGEQSANVWVAKEDCNFKPSFSSIYVINNPSYTISEGSPHKLRAQQIQDIMEVHQSGGIYFGKILSTVSGKIVVEKIPLGLPQGNAIPLKHGEKIQLEANDERVFCFPKNWKSTVFMADMSQKMAMHISHTSEFDLLEENQITKYEFLRNGDICDLQLSTEDISTLGNTAVDDYLYVRFENSVATTLTPLLWNTTSCANQSILVRSGERFLVPAESSATLYRMRYEDWRGYDFSVKWTGVSPVTIYVASDCNFMLTQNDPSVLTTLVGRRNISTNVLANTIANWEKFIEDDGFVYIRLNTPNQGRITFTSIKPEPVLPDTIFTTITETLCYGESYEWNGQVYATTGEYTQNFTAANGADSIVTLKLTILPEVAPTTEEATIEAGETYTWNGKEYSEAGEYTITLQDKNGCDYQATLVLTVNEPLSPCLQSSVKLNVGDEIVINLDSAFTVYAIDYAAWMAQPVTLVWTGAEALHTFVAETCVFALAPHNRYVHAYVPVPAQGDSALDMEALAPYVDADGYLYVRFLTEFEGTLKVGR